MTYAHAAGKRCFKNDPAEDWRELCGWLAMAARGRGGPGRRGRHGYGGPRGRHGGRRPRGDVRAAILVLLDEEPRNGYGIMQEIEERSAGVWRPSPGSVYPVLQQLEDEGLVRADESGERRLMQLTQPCGRSSGAALTTSMPGPGTFWLRPAGRSTAFSPGMSPKGPDHRPVLQSDPSTAENGRSRERPAPTTGEARAP